MSRPSLSVRPAFAFFAAMTALGVSALLMPLSASAGDKPSSKTLPSGVVVTLTANPTTKGATLPRALPTDMVRVHYRGTLANGVEFDSSYKRGEPATFPLNRVIPCWTQGLQEIPVGAKATLRCPAHTAYGDSGIPGVIPPKSELTFEVELLAVERR